MKDFSRTFAAFKLTPSDSSLIYEKLRRIRNENPTHKWVKQENLHVTLRFFGPTSHEQAVLLGHYISELPVYKKPLTIKIGEINAFPSLRSPRVIVLDIASSELVKTARAIEVYSRTIGFDPEKRKFRAHMTIARIRKKGFFIKENVDLPSSVTGNIVFLKSTLTSSGPIYEIITAKKNGRSDRI